MVGYCIKCGPRSRLLAHLYDLYELGDEDQCIYAWRRADVERIIDFDKVYPGLARTVLRRNYRCASDIVRASADLTPFVGPLPMIGRESVVVPLSGVRIL